MSSSERPSFNLDPVESARLLEFGLESGCPGDLRDLMGFKPGAMVGYRMGFDRANDSVLEFRGLWKNLEPDKVGYHNCVTLTLGRHHLWTVSGAKEVIVSKNCKSEPTFEAIVEALEDPEQLTIEQVDELKLIDLFLTPESPSDI